MEQSRANLRNRFFFLLRTLFHTDEGFQAIKTVAGPMNEHVTHISAPRPFCPAQSHLVLYRLPPLLFCLLVLRCSVQALCNLLNRFTVDRGEKVRPFPVIFFPTVRFRIQEFCEFDMRFMRCFVSVINVVKKSQPLDPIKEIVES